MSVKSELLSTTPDHKRQFKVLNGYQCLMICWQVPSAGGWGTVTLQSSSPHTKEDIVDTVQFRKIERNSLLLRDSVLRVVSTTCPHTSPCLRRRSDHIPPEPPMRERGKISALKSRTLAFVIQFMIRSWTGSRFHELDHELSIFGGYLVIQIMIRS